MVQIYHHYELWEDYMAGMYNIPCEVYEVNINNCVELLTNSFKFYEVMNKLVNDWVYSTDVNLSNVNCNRCAWLGAAACCYHLKQEEVITRLAWNRLSELQKIKANQIANKIILEYERRNNKLHKNLGETLLF